MAKIFVGLLLLICAIQLVYWMAFFVFAWSRKREIHSFLEPVSMIVVARNEEENLKKLLPALLSQDYPNFEIVVVNDRSWDETRFVVEELMAVHKNLRLVNVNDTEEFWLGKKYGLTLGLKASNHKHVLLTDADCTPASARWLRLMASGFARGSVVLGYGGYEKMPGLLNGLIRFETLQTALQYMAFAKWGLPYMGVGRNLGYEKTLFFNNRGFVKHMQIPSGDDDLLINQIATAKNTRVIADPEAHTLSIPKKTWAEWWHQKRRHHTTGRYYKSKIKTLLALWGAVQLAFYPLLLIVALAGYPWLALAVFGLRSVFFFAAVIPASLKFKDAQVLLPALLADLLLPWFSLVWLLQNRFERKPKKW